MQTAARMEQRGAAVIVSGAVAKGAFAAGALRMLAERRIKVARLVGASSGAINAAGYAAGVRAGNEFEAAQRIERLWIEKGHLLRVFDFDPWSVLRGRGLADHDRLLQLLRDEIRPALMASADVQLGIAVTALKGRVETLASGQQITTYEHIERFDAAAFDETASIERVLGATVASASLPVGFVPRNLGKLGACVDGGLVNNTPIGEAIRDSSIRTVYVISPLPARDDEIRSSLVWVLQRVLDIALNERLCRDLMRAEQLNSQLPALSGLVKDGSLTEAQHEQVLAALSWQGRRQLTIVPIRPQRALTGDYLRAFLSRALRQEYVELGREAAKAALDAHAASIERAA